LTKKQLHSENMGPFEDSGQWGSSSLN